MTLSATFRLAKSRQLTVIMAGYRQSCRGSLIQGDEAMGNCERRACHLTHSIRTRAFHGRVQP